MKTVQPAKTGRSSKSYKSNAWLTDVKIEELRQKVVNENNGCDDAERKSRKLVLGKATAKTLTPIGAA